MFIIFQSCYDINRKTKVNQKKKLKFLQIIKINNQIIEEKKIKKINYYGREFKKQVASEWLYTDWKQFYYINKPNFC